MGGPETVPIALEHRPHLKLAQISIGFVVVASRDGYQRKRSARRFAGGKAKADRGSVLLQTLVQARMGSARAGRKTGCPRRAWHCLGGLRARACITSQTLYPKYLRNTAPKKPRANSPRVDMMRRKNLWVVWARDFDHRPGVARSPQPILTLSIKRGSGRRPRRGGRISADC